MDLLVIEYLKTHSFQQLEDTHGVCARPSTDRSKYSLNYDQILVKSGDKLAEQCRGLIIRPWAWTVTTGDEWKDHIVGDVDVLARPMDRFYNHGDTAGAQIDWSDPKLKVLEKLDGTMIIMYWDPLKQQWCAGTRSVPEADLPIRAGHMEIGDMTFAELFWRANYETSEAWIRDNHGTHEDFETFKTSCEDWYNKKWTYVFELTTPWNRVVVRYNEPRITLLAIRETATGRELDPVDHGVVYIPLPESWSLRDPIALAAFIDQADPAKLEGAVVVSSSFSRLKVKNKSWILSSKAKDLVTVSRRSALEAIILEKIDDIIPLLEKDVGDELLRMQSALARYCKVVDGNFAQFKEMASGSRKLFAEQVMLSGDWTPAYFNLWENKSPNALAWVKSMCERGKLSSSSLDTLLSKLN